MRTYTQFIAYFEKAAEHHLKVQHTQSSPRFFALDLMQITEALQHQDAMPAIGLERPYINGRGNHANIRLNKMCALMVFDRCYDPRDNTEVELAYQNCYEIAKDLMAKMLKDAKLYDQDLEDYVLPGLDPQSFNMETMPQGIVADSTVVGVRLSFVFDEPLELFDPEKWSDEELNADI
jgi:hypothetical protein